MRLLAGVLCVTTASLAAADDLRPLYVEVNENIGHRYLLRIKTPPRVLADNVPQIVFPETCGTSASARAPTLIHCAGALSGAELSDPYSSSGGGQLDGRPGESRNGREPHDCAVLGNTKIQDARAGRRGHGCGANRVARAH